MAKSPVRDYASLVERTAGSQPAAAEVSVLARADGYPIFHVRVETDREAPRILLLAGVHSDEPARCPGGSVRHPLNCLCHVFAMIPYVDVTPQPAKPGAAQVAGGLGAPGEERTPLMRECYRASAF